MHQKHITLTTKQCVVHITSVDSYEDYCQTTTENKPMQLLIFMMSAPPTLTHHYAPPQQMHRAVTTVKMTAIQQHIQPFQPPIHPTCSPRVPISYNETFLSKKHRHLQVKIMNTLSIPLPETDTDEENQKSGICVAFKNQRNSKTEYKSCILSVYHFTAKGLIPYN